MTTELYSSSLYKIIKHNLYYEVVFTHRASFILDQFDKLEDAKRYAIQLTSGRESAEDWCQFAAQ